MAKVATLLTLSIGATSMISAPAVAQDLFAPIMKVNDRVITAYEYSQRVAFLTILKAPGNIKELARKQLTDEALQRQAAAQGDVTPSADDIRAGMEEFAQRFKLDVKTFNKIIAQAGVAPETFRDFVSGGIAWRQVVRARWAGRIKVTDDEIDRQIAAGNQTKDVQVLLSEIILPAQTPQQQQIASARASQLTQITTLPAFAAAARSQSAAPSRGRSGRLEWMPLSNLPPAVAGQILPLAVGHVTSPIPVRNGIALFQLRALKEASSAAPKEITVDYALLNLANDALKSPQQQVAEIRAKADTCNDLYGLFDTATEDQLQRHDKKMNEISTRYAVELAKLDKGELSSPLPSASGQHQTVLMLCARNLVAQEEVDRETIKKQLENQRLQSFSSAYLDELKAAAYIEDYSRK
jgi:peptidyl-prolyl cis-trans isomerase SurA